MNRAELLRLDPRLERRVTVTHATIHVGELLEILAAQSGINLTASERDGASDEIICVFARDTPLVDLMSGVWSLMSYQGATWRWLREGDGKTTAYSYRLTRPGPARAFAENVRAEIQQAMEEDVEACISALSMSTEQLPNAVARNPEIDLLRDPRVRGSVAGFAAAVATPEARLRVLRGLDKVSIPSEQWPDALREYVRTETDLARRMNPHREIPDPTHVHYNFEYYPGSITPSLSALLGDESSGQGYAAVGGTPMRNRWNGIIRDRWVLENDLKADPEREARVLPEPPKRATNSDPKEIDNSAFERGGLPPGAERVRREDTPKYLDEINALTRIPVMARLSDQTYVKPPRAGQTVSEFLHPFSRHTQQFKWRDGTLLISYPGVLREKNEDKVPWAALKRIRADLLADPQRMIPFTTACWAARRLNKGQLERLKYMDHRNFFAALAQEGERFAPLAAVKPALIDRLFTKEGVPLSALPLAFREGAARKMAELRPGTPLPRDARVRVFFRRSLEGPEEMQPDPQATERVFWLAFVTGAGKQLLATPITWSGRYEPEKMQPTAP